jgi:hypothetical protein
MVAELVAITVTKTQRVSTQRYQGWSSKQISPRQQNFDPTALRLAWLACPAWPIFNLSHMAWSRSVRGRFPALPAPNVNAVLSVHYIEIQRNSGVLW